MTQVKTLEIRKRDDRGHFNIGWLNSYHTFSFGHYFDPQYMGFRALRVINDDRIAPGGGFDTHGHRDMEIITYVLEGALEHKDSLGTGSIIYPGEVQRMSAGTGIMHSEFNNSQTDSVHLLQIWILPGERGLSPSYEQRTIPVEEKQGKLRLIASPDGRGGAVTVHQDVELYAAVLAAGDSVTYDLKSDRHAWLQVASGTVTLNGYSLTEGDGASVSGKEQLEIATDSKGEILLFDLA